MPQGLDEDTDRHAAIKLRHLSPTFALWLDREVGRTKERNGGYSEVNIRFEEGGRVGLVRWLLSFMPAQWRRDLNK